MLEAMDRISSRNQLPLTLFAIQYFSIFSVGAVGVCAPNGEAVLIEDASQPATVQ